MEISTDVILWIASGAFTICGAFITKLINANKKLEDETSAMQQRIAILEHRSPTPEQLSQSISGIGARVGELESHRSVTKLLLDQMSQSISEQNSSMKELTRIIHDIKTAIVRIDYKLDINGDDRKDGH